ncbi:DegV family protein [Bacillus songklensis]|uniref:DegV family protein n=1 Tax=Bacillus songklensis TaxID=1069116 RepID=A0ABV8B3G9_9BACI
MSIKIVTDSASDLPLHFFQEHDVQLLPLRVHVNDKEYLDLETIQPHEVFEYIRHGAHPKTSQAAPNTIYDTFESIVKNGDAGIYIAFSSQLSGTYQTSVMMQQEIKENYPDAKIEVIDTKCASLGQGLVVHYAVQLLKQQLPFEELVEKIKAYSHHMEHIFTVDNLDFLAKGGRVSKTSAFVGGLLNIKPLLHVEDGKLIPIEKIRGRKKVLKRMVELMEERGQDLASQTIAISHGDDEHTALELKQLITEKFGCQSFIINSLGSAVGSHAGPGTIALFFLNDTLS